MGKYTKSTISLYLHSEHLVDYLRFMASKNNTTVTRYINQLVIDDYIKHHNEGGFSEELAADYIKMLAVQTEADRISEEIKEKSKAMKKAKEEISKKTTVVEGVPSSKKPSFTCAIEDE